LERKRHLQVRCRSATRIAFGHHFTSHCADTFIRRVAGALDQFCGILQRATSRQVRGEVPLRPNVHWDTNITALPDYRTAEAAAFGTLGWWQCNSNISAPQAACDPAPNGVELPGVHPSVQPPWSVDKTKTMFLSTPHMLGVAQTDLGTGSGGLFGAVTESDGVMILFPYRNRPNYPTRAIPCEHPNYTGPPDKIGFDGRCRGWYQSAIVTDETRFSSPYIFAGSGLLGVTASKSFVNESAHPRPHTATTPKEGACFMDYSFDDVAVVVEEQLLESGYGYLVDRTTGSAIVHPNLDFANPPASTAIEAMEFQDTSTAEAVEFSQNVLPRIFSNSSGRTNYDQEGRHRWSLSWRHIALSPYVLVLTVPQEDIEAPILRVETFMQSFIVGMVTALAVILAMVFVCIAAVGRRIMQLVVGPVRELKRLAADIQAGKTRLSAERYTLRKPTLEVSRLAQALRQLHVLIRVGNSRVVEGDVEFAGPMLTEALELFKRLGNAKAVGVCYTNLGAVAMQRRDFKEAIAMYQLAVQNSRDIIAKHLTPEARAKAVSDGRLDDTMASSQPIATALYIEEGADSVAEATTGAAARMNTRLASVMEEDIVAAAMATHASTRQHLPTPTASAARVGSAAAQGHLLDDSMQNVPKLKPMGNSTLRSNVPSAADSENPVPSSTVIHTALGVRRGPLQLSLAEDMKVHGKTTDSIAQDATLTDEFVIGHVPVGDEAILTYSARSAVSEGHKPHLGDSSLLGMAFNSGSRGDSYHMPELHSNDGLQLRASGVAHSFSTQSSTGLLGSTLVLGQPPPAATQVQAPLVRGAGPQDDMTPSHIQPFASLPIQAPVARHAHFALEENSRSSSEEHPPGVLPKASSSAGRLPTGADPAAAALQSTDLWGSRGALAHVMHRVNTRMALGDELGDDSVPVVAAPGDLRHAQLLQQLAARQANLAKAYMSRARLLADAALVQRLGGYVPAEQEAPLRSLDLSDRAHLRSSVEDARSALNALEHAGRHLTAAVPALESPQEAAAAHMAATEAFTDAALAAAHPSFARRVAALARFAQASLVRCQLCLDEALRDCKDEDERLEAEHKHVLLQRRVRAAEGAALAADGKSAGALRQFAAALTIGTVCSRDFDARVLWAMARLLLDLNQLAAARGTATLAGAHVSGPREFSFVVDNSSSMGEDRLIHVAMDNVLSLYDTYVLPIDRVCLITYTRRAVMRVEPRRKGSGRRAAKTRALIDSCRTPRGGTACYDGILAAVMQQVARAKAQTQTGKRTAARYIVVVTDGTDTMSRATAADTAAIIAEVSAHTPLTLHIVGVGPLQNEEALRCIAAASPGGHFIPTDATRVSIDAAFNHISAAVAEVYVEAV